MEGRGGEGGEAEEGRSEKAVDKDFATCPQGHIYSKSRHGREDKGGGGQGQGREEGETSPIVDGRPSKAVGTTKVVGHRRVRVTEAAFPPHRLVLESPLRANRGVPIVREPRSPRGWGWGVGSFRVITAVFFLFLLAQLPPRPWPASEPSARTIRPVASGCPPIQLCERFR